MKICPSCRNAFSMQEKSCGNCKYEVMVKDGVDIYAPELSLNSPGFRPEYFSELSKFESNNFWFQARNELIIWALSKYKKNIENFLEVGCGTGYVMSGLFESNKTLNLYGSEIYLEGLDFAKKRVPVAKFMQMDARAVPFIDEFDAIGAFDVLEHIEDDRIVLSEIHKALKPQGVVILTVPQHPWLWSQADDYACHVRRYTESEIEEKLRSSGFKILRSTSFVSFLLPLMIISRLLNKHKKEDYDPMAEFKIHPVLNFVLKKIMMLDVNCIKLGVNYKFGGSRMIVACKE